MGRGVARGVPGMPVTTPVVSFFNQTVYNWCWKPHDSLASNLTLIERDPSFKIPVYAPDGGSNSITLHLTVLTVIHQSCRCKGMEAKEREC